MTRIFGIWDPATLSAAIVAVGGAIAALWPRWTKMGVEAEEIRTKAVVDSNVRFWKDECARLREEIDKKEEKFRVLERDLHLQCQQAESRLQLAVSQATRYKTLWQIATNQDSTPLDGPELAQPPAPAPSSAPACGGKGGTT
jgi:hypothetical protein